jgi:hypothetical protein
VVFFFPNIDLDFKHSIFSANTIHHSILNEPKHNPWILDKGAIDHMVCSLSIFTSITAIVSTHVKLPNDTTVSITHIGTINISESLTLIEVLFILSFTFNLIFVSK